ncbi:GDNF-inducible zinc finger protein 1 [Eumeta japonica]|uniref:GDNF-inducible zinc finger protein 1 n=1 Tax=Eumeta variegata TaxID=151549 RepID=A0A4C1T4X4_EUMVA|nr:GDNF-inducible zinc finger protein 1 [Eumeta japonica]
MHSTVDAIAKPIVEETVVPFNNEKSVADIVHEEIVPAETSAVNNIQVQNQEDCEENMCSILAEKLINAGVLEVDGDTLNLSRTQKGMLELEMADGTVVTFQIQEESESEQEEAITVSLPSECVRWAQPMLYECLQCHQRFERRHSYLKHLERHQKEDKPKWCCVICGKQFPSRSALARHRRVHSGERPYHCEHCPRAFAQKEVLVRHSALHAAQTKLYNSLVCAGEAADGQLLPNDMANYMEYHVMGSVSQIRMKPGCVPSKFECQPDRRKRTSDSNERKYIAKSKEERLALTVFLTSSSKILPRFIAVVSGIFPPIITAIRVPSLVLHLLNSYALEAVTAIP